MLPPPLKLLGGLPPPLPPPLDPPLPTPMLYGTVHCYCHISGNSLEVHVILRRSDPEVIKLFMLNSAEHEIFPAHKY